MNVRRILITIGGALALGFAGFGASATQLSYSFAGTLTSSFGSLSAGDAFSGTYTIESSIVATGTSTTSSSVFNNLVSASLVVGSFSATIGPGAGLPELQQDNLPGADRYSLVGRNPVGSSTIGGLAISVFGFRLDDTTGTAISDALTLLTNPNLANFSSNSFFIFFGSPLSPDFQVVSGYIEPPDAASCCSRARHARLACGLIGVGLSRRKSNSTFL
jgi:hypothetical protein